LPAAVHALLPIQVSGRWLVLDALAVQEILGQRPWVPVPGAPVNVPGVLAWRGRAIAVLDLGAVTEVAQPLAPGDQRPRAVVVKIGETTVALLADAAREVQQVAADRVRPPHAARLRFASGEVEFDGVPMPVLDLGGILEAIAGVGSEAA
jgi:chemotaxis signal transduction protein